MSKAFTKEDDSPEGDRLPDLPLSAHPNYVTPEGLADLQTRLATARTVSLTPPEHNLPARQAAAVARRDIRWLEARISSVILIDPATQATDKVTFGMEVEVMDEDGASRTFRIVGEDQADPAHGLIAPHSPLAQALLESRIGDTVDWPRPTGTIELEIVGITPPARVG